MSSKNTIYLDKTETPGQRLLYAIKISEMTQRKFAGLIGVSPNGLNQIVKGKNRLSRILALATEQITGVRAEWILNNENPMHVDPSSKIDPWDRMVLEFYGIDCDTELFVHVFGEIERKTSPFRNSIDPNKAWSQEQNDKYQALISEAKSLVDYFIHLEASEGQGPYCLGLMILHGGFSEKELENSEAAGYTEEDRHPSIERIREIRLELDDLINNPNTKGD
jgi:plasmid maintenance system antidote protein VapI